MDENSIVEVGHESETRLRFWEVRHESVDDPRALVEQGIEAICLIAADLLEAVAIRTTISWFDTTLGVMSREHAPLAEWKLIRRDAGYRTWVGERVTEVDMIDRGTVAQFLDRACNQIDKTGLTACPSLISISGVRARLLEPLPPSATWLRLERHVGYTVLPIERVGDAAWVTAPQDLMVPVSLGLAFYDSELHLRVEAYWSPWGEADRPGTRALEQRIAQLLSSGWEPTE